MKLDMNSLFWVVVDTTCVSEVADVCFSSNLERLGYYIVGGHVVDERWHVRNPSLYTDEAEARKDAEARLEARDKEARSGKCWYEDCDYIFKGDKCQKHGRHE